MSELPDFDPLPPDRGNVGSIRAVAQSFGSIDTQASAAQTKALSANTTLGGLSADATSAVQVKLDAVASQYRVIASSSGAARDALNTYATGVQGIQERAQQLRTQGQASYGRIQSIRARAMNSLWDKLVGVFVPWDGVPWEVLRTYSPALGNTWQGEIDTYKSLAASYNALWSERRAIDRTVTSALGSLQLASDLKVSLAGATTAATVLALSKSWAGGFGSMTAADFQAMGDPARVHEAWSKLTWQQRHNLLSTHPDIFGNLQGIPYVDRATANKTQLDLLRADKTLSEETQKKLTAIYQALRATPGATLISLELEGEEPRAAIAVGALDTAESVSYMVHGIRTDASGIGDWVRGASDFRTAIAAQGGTSNTAFVAWFRYDSGNTWTVSSHDLASAGAKKLAADLEGLSAVNPGAERILVGYSYGTTVVGEVIRTHSAYVDGVHFNGSAGLTPEAKQAVEAGIADKQFFATAAHASKDHIAPLGRNWFSSHQENPGDFSGVAKISTEGGYVGTQYGQQVDGHDAYDGEHFGERDSIYPLGESTLRSEKIAELERRGIDYEIRTVVVGRAAYSAIYTTSTGYLSPDSQTFLETVREYANRLK